LQFFFFLFRLASPAADRAVERLMLAVEVICCALGNLRPRADKP